MRSFFIVFMCVIVHVLNAQDNCNLTLSGKVIDEHDTSALDGASIVIKETGQAGLADKNGHYIIKGICAGQYTVVCSHTGCEPITLSLNIQQSMNYNFILEHHVQEIETIKIQVQKHKAIDAAIHNHISEEVLFKNQGKSLGKITEEVMGVTSLSTGGSIFKPVIHGLHSNRVLVFNNEVRHESQQWGSEHGPEIDPFTADEIIVIKGANTLRYGSDAMGGVILIEPKRLKYQSGLRGEINMVGISNGRQGVTSMMLEGAHHKIKGLTFRAQGSYKRGGNQQTPDYYLKNTGIEEYNFSLASNYAWKKNMLELFYSQFNTNIAIFSGSHIGNLTDLYKAFAAEKPLDSAGFTYELGRPYQHIEHELLKVKNTFVLNNKNDLKLMYSRQYNLREEFDLHYGYGGQKEKPSIHLEITTHIANLIWENKHKQHLFTAGINGISRENTFEGTFFIPNFKYYSSGAYSIVQWWNRKWILEGGLRYDYVWQRPFIWKNEVLNAPVFTYQNISGNIAATHKINKNLSLLINAGYAWRPPAINELYSNGLHHGAASIEVGDENLKQEKSSNVIASVKYESKKVMFESEGYFNYIKDFIYLSPSQTAMLTIKGAFPIFYYKHCDASLSGLNWQTEYNFFQFILKNKGAFLWAWNNTDQDYIAMMPANQLKSGIAWKSKDYKFFTKNSIEGNVKNVFKQARIPNNTELIGASDAYTLLNLQFNTTLQLGKQNVVLAFEIDNLLNTRYRDYLNRFRYYSDDLGRTLSLRIKIPLIIKSHHENKN